MLSQGCTQTAQAASEPQRADPIGAAAVSTQKSPRMILLAAEPRQLSPTVLGMAQELSGALGLGVPMLPRIPRANPEEFFAVLLSYEK